MAGVRAAGPSLLEEGSAQHLVTPRVYRDVRILRPAVLVASALALALCAKFASRVSSTIETRWIRILTTFSGVASNFAGVPLAFAFVSTLGRTGFVTVILENWFGVDLYRNGFTLYSFAGLSLTYLYFQFPLMVLIMTPALEGLKREWREAADNLGASSAQYWRMVGLPILLPSILGSMILLFGNAFGAYATALALTGGRLNLVTILIGAQIRGDVLHDPNLGYALALGMVVIMALSIALYSWLQRRAERWLR